MTARATRRSGGVGRYRVHPAAPIAIPLSLTGLYAVHAPASQETRVYYCEPATGRCSCGAPSGSCPHIAVAAQCAAAHLIKGPRRRRRGA